MRQKEKSRNRASAKAKRISEVNRANEIAKSMSSMCSCNRRKSRKHCPWYQASFEV